MKNFLSYVLVSLLVSTLTVGAYHYLLNPGSLPNPLEGPAQPVTSQDSGALPATQVSMPNYRAAAPGKVPTDFHVAAEKTMPAVVYIKSIKTITQRGYDPFYEFFGVRPREYNSRQNVSSGSGVIISPEGYIVTNNHVIKDADELAVTLYDNRTYPAKVIGTDPSTDLGLIKVEANHLPTVEFVNSDQARVGEWVLAVGNPFGLASTATAGIISAIGRDLEIIQDQMAIESFIQTDAAVNPGNSGGALVTLQGDLVGINTAIASPTGTYAGYAFAVPANIVRKVVADLKEFGTVQRGFIGIQYATNLNSEVAAERGLSITEGVIIEKLADFGGAREAGLKIGDVVVSIDGIKIRNDAKLLELVGRNRPGDSIQVKVYREGRYRTFDVQLTSQTGSTTVSAPARNELFSNLGVELRDLSAEERRAIGVERGVLVERLYAGKFRQSTDMREKFIILKVNDEAVSSSEDITRLLEGQRGTAKFTGFYPRYNRLFTYSVELE